MPRSASLKLALLAAMPILLLQSVPAASQVQGVIPVPTRTVAAAAAMASPSQPAYTTPPIPTSNPNAQIQITVPVKLSGLPADAAVFRVVCQAFLGRLPMMISAQLRGSAYVDIPAAAPGALRAIYTEVTVPITANAAASARPVKPAELIEALGERIHYSCDLYIARNRNDQTLPGFGAGSLQGDTLFYGGHSQPATGPSTQAPQSTFILANISQTVGFVEGDFP